MRLIFYGMAIVLLQIVWENVTAKFFSKIGQLSMMP